jgi:hypothetical protein
MQYTVVFSELAKKSIGKYIFLYADYFEEFFTDTWLWCEEDIQELYKKSAKELYRQIYDTIEEKFSRAILPYSVLENVIRSTTLILWNRRIALEYEESENIRTITDIKIWYKH